MDSTANLCLKALVSKMGGSVVLPLKDIQRADVLTISTLAAQQPPSVKVSVERVGEPLKLLHVPEHVFAKAIEMMILTNLVMPIQDPIVAHFIKDFTVFIKGANVGKFGISTEVYLEKRE